ncbi:MAG: insulinase family protein [Oscillospiraceae bacterium]|nr:insulinase family protein [Oscillospiraceae bacterium]
MTTNILLAPGVTLRALQTEKFKTGCFSINFLRGHNARNAALDALLPSVLLRGTERYPDIQSISNRLDTLYGSTFGTMVRQKGETKLLGFYADFLEDCFVPEGGIFAGMLEFLEQVLYHPYTENGIFCEEYVDGERRNLINTIESSLNDKRAYAHRRLMAEMCKDEDYGVPRFGTVEEVQAITTEELWSHYHKTLTYCPIEIFYGGRLRPEEVAEVFRPLFAHRQAQQWEQSSTKLVPAPSEPRVVTEAMDVTQGKLVMGLRSGIIGSDPDYMALALLTAVYGGGTTGKLFRNVREKLSLCYYASASYDRYKGIFLISSGIASENYDIAKDAILAELDACKNGIITPEELEAARSQILSALRAAMDAPNRLDDFFIGQGILPGPDIPEQIRRIQTLTVSDLAQVARKLRLDTIYFLKGENA